MDSIYKAAVINTRELKKTLTYIKRTINRRIKENKLSDIGHLTKIYALIYSTWMEANLLKIIHTPSGFSEEEIEQINNSNSIQIKWKKLVELAFRKFNLRKGPEIPNKIKKLSKYIDVYIFKPSQYRNKIAHGQWKVALNKQNTRVVEKTSIEINNISFDDIYIWIQASALIVLIIEDIVKSKKDNGNKAHYRNYEALMCDIKEFEEKSSKWSTRNSIELLQSRKKIIFKKTIMPNNGYKQ